MPKSSKRFIISDESVNRYGFRVLTSGIDLSQFEKNPLCLYMHRRSDKNSEYVSLPIGHWQDLAVENNVLTGVPFISDNDDFAMQIFHKIEEGTIRMASAGLEPLALSETQKDMLPGQLLPTVSKSIIYEASICDMGVNNNALVVYGKGKPLGLSVTDSESLQNMFLELSSDSDNNVIPLIKHNKKMKPELLALAIQLGMKNASEEEVLAKLTANHTEFLTLSQKVTDAEKRATAAEAKVKDLELATKTAEVEAVLNLAVTDGKITEAQKPEYLELANSNLQVVKNLFDKMPKHVSAQAQLAATAGDAADPMLKLSFDEAHKQGKLDAIKKNHPKHYEQIFESKYNRKPTA